MLLTSAELFERADAVRAEYERAWFINLQLYAEALARLSDLNDGLHEFSALNAKSNEVLARARLQEFDRTER